MALNLVVKNKDPAATVCANPPLFYLAYHLTLIMSINFALHLHVYEGKGEVGYHKHNIALFVYRCKLLTTFYST